MVRISAVVCTHNRAGYLRKALVSLAGQALPPDQHEIIVVDNASSDETRAVVQEVAGLPNLHYVYEGVPGLSRARNVGWQAARGEYVAYLDDDAVASPGWLAAYLRRFDEFRPAPGSVGGRCMPIWEAPKPEWLSDRLLSHFSVFHWSEAPAVLRQDQWLSGCNIAYPRRLLEKVGGFGEGLGRTGGSLLGNEENFIRLKLDALGWPSVYDPGIVVDHHISASRLTKEWFRRASFGQGMSEALMVRLDRRPSLSSRAAMALGKIVWSIPRSALMFAEASDAGRFRRECQVREVAGFAAGMWRAS